MKRYAALAFRHGTACAWALLGLAWLPLVLVYAMGTDSWATFGWLLLSSVSAVVCSALGALIGLLTAVRLDAKGAPILAFLANLTSLLLLLGALSG